MTRMTAHSTQRCFFAIQPDAVALDDLIDTAGAFRRVPGIRLVSPQNIHLTVKFLGDVEASRMDDVLHAAALAVEGIDRFELNINNTTYLSNPRRPRVVAASCNLPDMLAKLVDQMEDTMHAIGFAMEGRRYRPHITLGRFRKPPPRSAYPLPEPECPATGFVANEMVLLESHLQPEGPLYTRLAAWSFE